MNNKNRLVASLSESMVVGALAHHLDWMDATGISLKQADFSLLNHQVMYDIMRERWLDRNYEISAEQLFLEAEKHEMKGKHTISIEMCRNIKQLIGEYSFETFTKEVERLNKLKILRKLNEQGFDILPIIGEDEIGAPSIVNVVDEYTIDEILNSYRRDLDDISESVELVTSKTSIKAADNLREMLEEMKNSPMVGALLDGDIYNVITKGAIFGKYHLNSSTSGVGKTRIKIGNALTLAMPRVMPNGQILVREEGYERVLFVTTELTPEEIQTAMVACVSGVEEELIKTNNLSIEQSSLVNLALEIIEMYTDNFYIEQIPDPSVALVKAKLETHIRRNGVMYIFYDYIFASPALSFENRGTREDVVLMFLSDVLKNVAATQNVFVSTSTQVNGTIVETGARDVSMVRGSKAIADKADIGMITVDIGYDEEVEIQTIVDTMGCPMPNIVTDIYKNRGGRYKSVKIFRYFDKGTCRMEDLFLTNDRYEVIPLTEKYKSKEKLVSLDELRELKGVEE